MKAKKIKLQNKLKKTREKNLEEEILKTESESKNEKEEKESKNFERIDEEKLKRISSKISKEEKDLEKENQHIEEALDSELQIENPKQAKEINKLVDSEEELMEPGLIKTSPNLEREAKEFIKPIIQLQDLADASLIGSHIGKVEDTTDMCKRFKILKSGKKVQLKSKKGCVEKIKDTKIGKVSKAKPSKMQAMPDTQESVGALSLNPGYSTLPGAEARPISNHEVSFYYDNTKLNHNMGSYRDNIYGDSTSSNIYDPGVDMNGVADRFLEKDVQDTFSLINAQDVINKAKNIKKKGKISKTLAYKKIKPQKGKAVPLKTLKKATTSRNKTQINNQNALRKAKAKVTKANKKTMKKNIDAELKKNTFMWK